MSSVTFSKSRLNRNRTQSLFLMRTILFLAATFVVFSSASQTTKYAPILVRVMNSNKEPIANDKIVFQGRTTHRTVEGITDDHGTFLTKLPAGEVYAIRIDAIGDQLEYNTLEIPSIPENAQYGQMELFVMYDMPEIVTLSFLQFETGKSSIKSSSYTSLDQLAEFLKRKKTQKIRIVGHTDNIGDPNSNLRLSLERAEAVKKYLLDQGVPSFLLTTEGYGSSKPIADNATTEGRALNRRTEIHLVP